MKKTIFQTMIDKWPSAIVARSQVGEFTGGLIHPRTMANIDSRGEGPERIEIGRRVGYPVENFVAWLASRQSGKA